MVRLQELFPQEQLVLVFLLLVILQQLKPDGNAFSFSQSFTQGDAIPTAAPTVGAVPNFSSLTSYTAGDKTGLAGTVGTSGALTVTAGGLVLQQQDNS